MTQRDQQQKKLPAFHWVRTPEDGVYALLIAVVELARRDAKLNPGKYANQETATKAQHAKDTADWFLGHLEYQRNL